MKILQMTTYDIEHPNHGGKLRAHHIRKSLRRTFDVQTLSFEWGNHEDLSSMQATLDLRYWSELGIDRLTIDLGICVYIDRMPMRYERVCEMVRNYSPDVLMLEQPYMFPLARRLVEDGIVPLATKLIYGSQNIEADMKIDFYRAAFPEAEAERLTQVVEALEKDVIRSSCAAIAVTQSEVDYIKLIEQKIPVRMYMNGHTAPVIDPESEVYSKWKARFMEHKTNWVFTGSWHPPNIHGLRRVAEALLAWKPKENLAIWVLGGVGDGLRAAEDFREENYPWLHLIGPASAEDIDITIMLSTGVLLPIWDGGGSNLKTAQALLSGKAIVAPPFAFRGFEQCMDEAGVFLADEAQDIARFITQIEPEATYLRSAAVTQLEWDAILDSLPEFIDRSLASCARPCLTIRTEN